MFRIGRAIILLLLLGSVACEEAQPATPTTAPTRPAGSDGVAGSGATELPRSTPAPAGSATPVPAAATATPTVTPLPSPSATPTATRQPLQLKPVQEVVAFPGPAHYQGDRLTLVVPLSELPETLQAPVTLRAGSEGAVEVEGRWEAGRLTVPFDTSGLPEGPYSLEIAGENGPATVSQRYRFELRPAAERPQQEKGATWETRTVSCCNIHFVSNTAAARDIEQIAAEIRQAAAEFAEQPGVTMDETVDIYLIDRMLFNGGFGGGGQLIATYMDRNYGPARGLTGLRVLARHEFAHAADLDAPFFRYQEGLGLLLAGGHYKPEPLARRAAAMYELHYFNSLARPQLQHEIRYLHEAGMLTYLVDAYGWEGLWTYVEADSGQNPATVEQFEAAIEQTTGQPFDEFEQAYRAWLREQDPGQQVVDLQLTVQLQDLRREYQEKYAPGPWFVLSGWVDESFARPEIIPAVVRESRQPWQVAVELLIANGQQAIIDGEYEQARVFVDAVAEVLASGTLAHPLAAEYGAIAEKLASEGYEALALTLAEGEATAEVTQAAPALETVVLTKIEGQWELGAR